MLNKTQAEIVSVESGPIVRQRQPERGPRRRLRRAPHPRRDPGARQQGECSKTYSTTRLVRTRIVRFIG